MLLIVKTLLYFLVWRSTSFSTAQSNNIHSNFGKAPTKSNDFDVSVSVRNGQIFVNWSTIIGPWNLSEQVNMTVYFLTNYTDQYGDLSYGVNISTCVAKKYDNHLWKIDSLKGNLLEFCDKSGLCGPFDDDVMVLIDSNWIPKYKNLSCQLFTTCSNFISTFGIQIMVDANNRQYSYYSGELSISSQNIPPSPTNIKLLQNEAIGISWNYPNLSQLCGFGSRDSTDIRFVIRQYKFNHCIFIEEKTLDFHARIAKFPKISTTSNPKHIFYLSAMSLASNQTNRQWLKQIEAESSPDKSGVTHKVHGGMLSFSWQPEWNCLGKDVVEQALLCSTIPNSSCVPVCQVTLFNNGSISQVTSFSQNLLNFYNNHSDYFNLDSNKKDMVDGQWRSSSRTIYCNIFKQCVRTLSQVSIKKIRFDAGTNKQLGEASYPPILLLRSNQPRAPTNLRIVSVYQTNVTVAWDFQQCKWLLYTTDIYICVLNSVERRPCEKVSNGHPMSYMYTVKSLSYFTNYSIQVYAENGYDDEHKSPRTPYLTVQTKEGAPLKGPTIRGITAGKDGITLLWSLPSKSVLRGLPEMFVVEVLDDKNKTVLIKTLNGTNITSAIIKDVDKCDSFRVKICNSPTLCSQFSYSMPSEKPCRLKDPEKAKSLTHDPRFFVVLLLFFLLLVVIAITCFVRRRMRGRSRSRLPDPVPPDCNTDYVVTSQDNEYDILGGECLLLS